MVLKDSRLFTLAVTLAGCFLLAQDRQAQAQVAGPNGPFYNYYAPPVGGPGAAMYPCPRPTPPMVGHTYITYPPLLPQENLYKHRRHYTTVHPDAGVTTTRVHWGGSNVADRMKDFLIGPNTHLLHEGISTCILKHGPN